jgi:hypothetical protein
LASGVFRKGSDLFQQNISDKTIKNILAKYFQKFILTWQQA